jgi:hypothetical protein
MRGASSCRSQFTAVAMKFVHKDYSLPGGEGLKEALCDWIVDDRFLFTSDEKVYLN